MPRKDRLDLILDRLEDHSRQLASLQTSVASLQDSRTFFKGAWTAILLIAGLVGSLAGLAVAWVRG